jgi:hypothetical protein
MINFYPEQKLMPLLDGDAGGGGGEGGGEGGTGTGVLEGKVPMDGSGGEGTPKAGDFSIPKEYANEGWAKDLKTSEDVFKKLAGAESLIGSKVKLPDAETSDEDRNKFFEQFRPETSDEYTFNRDNQSEEMKGFQNEEMDKAVKDIFHKAGLAPWQAEMIQSEYEAGLAETIKNLPAGEEGGESAEEANAAFDKLAKEKFGENESAIMEAANKLIEAHTPEGFGDMLKTLPNEQAMALAGLLGEIQKNYIDEGTLTTLGDSISAEGKETLYEKGKSLMESPAYQNEFDPSHAKVKEQVDGIFKRLGSMG